MKFWIAAGCSFLLSACTLVSHPDKQKDGKTQWQINTIKADQMLSGNALSVFGDRSLALVGGGDEADFVLKRDPVGVIEWYRLADRSASNLYTSHYSRSGALIVAGDYPNLQTGVQQAYAIALNTNGKVRWQRQFDSRDDMAVLAIDETNDGGLVFAGQLYPAASRDRFNAPADSFVLKTTSEGKVEWLRTLRLPQSDQAEDVLALSDGRILALINHRDDNEQSLGVHLVQLGADGRPLYNERLLAEGFVDAAAMKLAPDGRSIWIAGVQVSNQGETSRHQMAALEVNLDAEVQRHFIDQTSEDAVSRDIAILADGSIAVVGRDQPKNTLEDLNVLYVHFDADGSVLERADFGGSGIDSGDAIQVLRDGTTLILATFNIAEEAQLTLISRAGS